MRSKTARPVFVRRSRRNLATRLDTSWPENYFWYIFGSLLECMRSCSSFCLSFLWFVRHRGRLRVGSLPNLIIVVNYLDQGGYKSRLCHALVVGGWLNQTCTNVFVGRSEVWIERSWLVGSALRGGVVEWYRKSGRDLDSCNGSSDLVSFVPSHDQSITSLQYKSVSMKMPGVIFHWVASLPCCRDEQC